MKPIKKNGFTIVETMLFLGISGALIMGILIGTGTSINTQRYRDSVTSLQSFLQKQYSNVASVSNEPTTDGNTCNDASKIPRGQSECFILGRYVTTTDGKTIKSRPVIGYLDPNPTAPSDDLDALLQYKISLSDVGAETYDIEWGSSAAKLPPNADESLAFSVLILRSPSSGIIRTFISDNNTTIVSDSDIGTLLTPANLLQPLKICLNSNGLFTGGTMSVDIDRNSTSASGVETFGDDSGC